MCLTNLVHYILVFIQFTNLLKSNVFSILSEALTAHVDSIFAN